MPSLLSCRRFRRSRRTRPRARAVMLSRSPRTRPRGFHRAITVTIPTSDHGRPARSLARWLAMLLDCCWLLQQMRSPAILSRATQSLTPLPMTITRNAHGVVLVWRMPPARWPLHHRVAYFLGRHPTYWLENMLVHCISIPVNSGKLEVPSQKTTRRRKSRPTVTRRRS